MAGIERVAFLGLGIMGVPMARHLSQSGFDVIVWNRTAERAREFAGAHGARAAATPAEASGAADATITMVVDGPQVEEVLFGETGAAAGMAPGHLAIDMSTIPPGTAAAIAERLKGEGIGFLDAPVTGSRPKAESGTLTIMAGGAEADLERARPLFEAMGEVIVPAGPVGHGQLVKLLNNTVAATNAATLAQTIAAARKLGVDLDALVRVLEAGSGNSTMVSLKARPMIEHDYEPLFKLEHMLKDVGHLLAAAEAAGAPMSVAQEAVRLYSEAAGAGPEGRDFAAIVEIAERDAGL